MEKTRTPAGSREWYMILMMDFVIGGFFGFLYEEIFYRIDLGYFVKRGTTLGPWIPIYGFGALLIVFATTRFRRRPAVVFLLAVLLTGLLEFATGYVLLHGFGVRLWDYNTEIWNWLNIGGYVCLRSVLFFGVSAMFLQYVIQPVFEWLIGKKKRVVGIAVVILAVLFAADILCVPLRRLLGRG